MNMKTKGYTRSIVALFSVAFLFVLLAPPAVAGGYDNALNGVKQVKVVFDVSQGSPKDSNVIFWAVKNVYEDDSVKALSMTPQVAIVFHGPAVKLITSDRSGFKKADHDEIDTFQDTLRQMKKDGVKLEVCDYALKVMGVDPATVLSEIDHVGNGFISVVGYQAQGYAVVRIP
jgi:intracellular sulfur oxidation DsrE/DsrF family protein